MTVDEKQEAGNNHDKHYLEIEQELGIQPIQVGEFIAANEAIPRKAAKHLATASEYLIRAGRKGEPWEKDARKAMNHIHRAITGRWIGEADK